MTGCAQDAFSLPRRNLGFVGRDGFHMTRFVARGLATDTVAMLSSRNALAAPIVSLHQPKFGSSRELVEFDGTSTTDSIPAHVHAFTWDFGDGQTASDQHRYARTGQWSFPSASPWKTICMRWRRDPTHKYRSDKRQPDCKCWRPCRVSRRRSDSDGSVRHSPT
jgi:hypothetical protein